MSDMPDNSVKLDTLSLELNDVRCHDADNIKRIAESLKQLGPARSIVVDEHGNVLAGKGTVLAAQKIGIQDAVIVERNPNALIAVQVSGLTSQEKFALMLADNAASDSSSFDPETVLKLDADLLSMWLKAPELKRLESELENMRVRSVIESGGDTEWDSAFNPANDYDTPPHAPDTLIDPNSPAIFDVSQIKADSLELAEVEKQPEKAVFTAIFVVCPNCQHKFNPADSENASDFNAPH